MSPARPAFIEDIGRASGVSALIASALGYALASAGWWIQLESAPETLQWLAATGMLGMASIALGMVAVWCATALYGDGIDGTELARFFAGTAAAASITATPLIAGSCWGFAQVLGV